MENFPKSFGPSDVIKDNGKANSSKIFDLILGMRQTNLLFMD